MGFLQESDDAYLQFCSSKSWPLALQSHSCTMLKALVLLIPLNARHYNYKISSSSDHEMLEYGGVTLR